MEWYFIVCIVVAALLVFMLFVFFFVIPFGLVQYMSYPKRWSRKESHIEDEKKDLLIGEEKLKRELFEVKMSDGYIIRGDISLQGDNKKFVILCHGYSVNRETAIKYAMVYYSLGYSIVLYDHRSHGDNVHKDVTMGFKESKDLHEIILWLKEQYGEDIFLGLHGESMGSATILQTVKYNDRIDFITEDCGYSNLRKLFIYLVRHMMHLSPFFIPMCDCYMKLFHGYHMKDASPIEYIKGCKIPLLIIHGENDTFIPNDHSEDIYQAFSGYKEKHIFPGAEHAESFQSNREKYKEIVENFVHKIENNEESNHHF